MDHHCNDCCNHEQPVPLQQSLLEVEFQRGLWGYILRDPTAAQVETFIDQRGKDCVNSQDASGYTPLLYAARRLGGEEVCSVLLKRGADVNAATRGFGQTPLHRAVSVGSVEIVALLLQYGAERSVKDSRGKTAYDVAVERSDVRLQALLGPK